MYRVARRSLAIFASAVVCVADTNALRTIMASGGAVPGRDALSASVGPSGSPILAADVVGSGGVSGATAAATAVRTADGEEGLSTAAAASAAAARSAVDR